MRYYMAGLSPHLKYIMDLPKPKYVLDSFFYIRKLPDEKIHQLLSLVDYDMDRFLLDSGAFTLMRQKVKGNINIEKYIGEYTTFIKKWGIKNFVEMDLDWLMPLSKVEEYRKMIDEGAGRKCMPVFHHSRGIDYLKWTCENYDYFCTGTNDMKTRNPENYAKLQMITDIVHSYGKELHGLGFSGMNLKRFRFDSVDATNWLMGAQYGLLYRFVGDKLVAIPQPKNTKRKHHNNFLRFNYIEYVKYQHFLDTIY